MAVVIRATDGSYMMQSLGRCGGAVWTKNAAKALAFPSQAAAAFALMVAHDHLDPHVVQSFVDYVDQVQALLEGLR